MSNFQLHSHSQKLSCFHLSSGNDCNKTSMFRTSKYKEISRNFMDISKNNKAFCAKGECLRPNLSNRRKSTIKLILDISNPIEFENTESSQMDYQYHVISVSFRSVWCKKRRAGWQRTSGTNSTVESSKAFTRFSQ